MTKFIFHSRRNYFVCLWLFFVAGTNIFSIKIMKSKWMHEATISSEIATERVHFSSTVFVAVATVAFTFYYLLNHAFQFSANRNLLVMFQSHKISIWRYLRWPHLIIFIGFGISRCSWLMTTLFFYLVLWWFYRIPLIRFSLHSCMGISHDKRQLKKI